MKVNLYTRVSHVGVDNHRRFSEVTARDADNEVLFRETWSHGSRACLRRELLRYPEGTPVILEGTFGWGWMSDELDQAGLDPHLASSRKVAAWREARGLAKNNRIDGDLLSELWPQRPRWWEVWLAPQEVRDRREWMRCRMALVQVQTMTKNRIHATLHRYGIVHSFSDLFGVGGRRFLAELVKAQEPLRESGRATLGEYLKLLEQVRRQIARLTWNLRKQVRRDEQAELWRSLPGIGWVLAYTIHAEVGDPWRFKSGRKLSRYALLAPQADESGEADGGKPIGRHVGWDGRLTLKWAFIEAAHGAVKDPVFRALFDRRTDGGQRDRNRGYIAVGHKLAEVGLACVKKRRPYSEAPPARPGSQAEKEQAKEKEAIQEEAEKESVNQKEAEKESTNRKDVENESTKKKRKEANEKPVKRGKAKRTSRPGMGQPENPMADAGPCGDRALS